MAEMLVYRKSVVVRTSDTVYIGTKFWDIFLADVRHYLPVKTQASP